MDSAQNSAENFILYLWRIRKNRFYLLSGISLSLIQLVVFKFGYPYPDFFSDSYSYISAAADHLNVSIWPIGYSKFLSLVHSISSADNFLIATQYILFQVAAFYLYFSLNYLYPLKNWVKGVCWAFIVFNPLTLYLCNTVNSDALFSALTLIWLAELLWLLVKPSLFHLLLQGFILFLCFSIRNNAYYYPLVFLVCLYFIRRPILQKIAGLAWPALLILAFISWTQREAFQLTGTRQYSFFTGWQMANNALYIYDRIQVDSNLFATPESRELNRMTLRFLRHQDLDVYRQQVESSVGNYFIREPRAPLKQYYSLHYDRNDSSRESLVRNWARISAVYEPFGKAILLHYPIAYARYFVLPNLGRYLIPPLSHIGLYNYGQYKIDPEAQKWFQYKKPVVYCISPTLQGGLLIYSYIFLIVNLGYVGYSVMFLLYRKRLTINDGAIRLFWVSSSYFTLNLLFSLGSTVNILRYQIAPLFGLILFSGWLSTCLDSIANDRKDNPIPSYPSYARNIH